MSTAAEYSAVESSRDGSRLEIRAFRPEDKESLIAAVGRASDRSLYRRFFSHKRGFTEKEVSYFLDIDFTSHVALVAALNEHGRQTIVGGARYVVSRPGQAELAFAVIDQYQGQGIGAALMRHLIIIARKAGLHELVAEVLPENLVMLTVFRRSGLPVEAQRDGPTVHVTLKLN